MITADDIEIEHLAAIAALTPAQHRAIARLRDAKQATHFNGRFQDQNLKLIFEREARTRSRQLEEVQSKARQAA